MKLKLVTGIACAALIATASSAFAGIVLVANSGWQYDETNALNAASEDSPVKLVVPTGEEGYFSLTDGFLTGDIYTAKFDGVTFQSTFTDYSTPFVNNLGPSAVPFAADWLDDSYSHLQLMLDPGTYFLTLKDISSPQLPAGFGIRLDTFVIPEISTWAMFGLGLASIGMVGLTRRRGAQHLAL